MRPIHMWRSRMSAHFPSVIKTIWDQNVQMLKPLNKRELNTT
jgi:hypothetical protein